MSNRERWILYPLLVFALLLGAKSTFDRLTQSDFRRIVCNEIRVESFEGRARVLVGESLEGAGEVTLCDEAGEPVVLISLTPQGQLSLTDVAGRPLKIGAVGHSAD